MGEPRRNENNLRRRISVEGVRKESMRHAQHVVGDTPVMDSLWKLTYGSG